MEGGGIPVGRGGGSGNCLLGRKSSVNIQGDRGGGRLGRRTAVVFAVIGDHEHHLPLKDIIIHEPARYSRKVFRCLNGL